MSTQSTEQQYYPSKDICDRFDISGSTLRKWCIALDNNGYDFARTEQNRRLFTDSDLTALEHMKSLIQDKRMSLDNASIIIASRFKDTRSSTGTPSVREENTTQNSPQVEKEMQDHIKRQEQFNQELLKRMDEQNKHLNERLDQRDKLLMDTMNKLMEERKKEVKLLEEVKEEQKKGLFSRLFNKKR